MLRAEAGSRPGGRGTFLCFAKEKYPKERRPPVCDPFAVRRGKPAAGRLRGAPWNSLRCVAASFRHPRRVSSRGMGASTPMLTPQPPRRRRSQQGWDSRTSKQPDIHSGHCFARPGLAGASATRCANWAERSKGPCGCFAPFAPLDAPRSAAGGVACVPKDTHASLSSSPQLFERSAPARSEFRSAHRPRAPRLPRSEAQGTQTVGSPLLWFLSFGDAKERDSPAGRLPASALNPSMLSRPARPGFDKLSPNGWGGAPASTGSA